MFLEGHSDMTNLQTRKRKLELETCGRIRGRALCVSPKAHYLEIREKGRRARFLISYETIYAKAAEIAARELRAARLEARKAKRAR